MGIDAHRPSLRVRARPCGAPSTRDSPVIGLASRLRPVDLGEGDGRSKWRAGRGIAYGTGAPGDRGVGSAAVLEPEPWADRERHAARRRTSAFAAIAARARGGRTSLMPGDNRGAAMVIRARHVLRAGCRRVVVTSPNGRRRRSLRHHTCMRTRSRRIRPHRQRHHPYEHCSNHFSSAGHHRAKCRGSARD